MSTPTGRHNPLCSQDTSSTISKIRETNFRLPEEWEAQEILDEEVVGEKTYYLISWKPTLVPETEVSTTLLQTWRDENAICFNEISANSGSKDTTGAWDTGIGYYVLDAEPRVE